MGCVYVSFSSFCCFFTSYFPGVFAQVPSVISFALYYGFGPFVLCQQLLPVVIVETQITKQRVH